MSIEKNIIKKLYNRITRKIGTFPGGYQQIEAMLTELVGDGEITKDAEDYVVQEILKEQGMNNSQIIEATHDDDTVNIINQESENITPISNGETPPSSMMAEYKPVDSDSRMMSVNEATVMTLDMAEELNVELDLSHVKSIARKISETSIEVENQQEQIRFLILEFIKAKEARNIANLTAISNQITHEGVSSLNRQMDAANQVSSHLDTQLNKSYDAFFRSHSDFKTELESIFKA